MSLDDFLKNLREKKVHFLTNQGNAGDGLIHTGFFETARRMGLEVETFEDGEERQGDVLLVMGAGAFCEVSWHKVEAVQHYSRRFNRVCILPATFQTSFAPVNRMLRHLPDNVTIFCRERISYEAVAKIVPPQTQVYLDHDLAFRIDAKPWIRAGTMQLNAFRTDGESLRRKTPVPNFDISNMGREYHHTLLLDVVSNFDSIFTDRLHVAIAGALLDKKVRLFEGSYHKIRGIYEYSLRDRFPKVRLCGQDELDEILKTSRRAQWREGVRKLAVHLPGGMTMLRRLKARRAGKATASQTLS